MIYPIGIPDAWVSPDIASPSKPSPWTSEIAGYYFVDWNTGTDSGRTYGSRSAPRKSIPNPIPAGSLVVMADGSYGGGIELELQSNGTSGAWVANVSGPAWIVGDSALGTSMCSIVLRGSYLYIDGLKWDQISNHRIQFSSASVDWSADHMIFRNCDIDGNAQESSYGIIIEGRSEILKTQFIVIYNCVIHDFGDMESAFDPDNNALATGSYVYDIWIIYNEAHTCTAGIRFGAAGGLDSGDTADKAQRGYIGGNVVHDILQSGLFVKYSKNVVFTQNWVYNILDTPWSPSKCVGAQYAPKGLWMIFNRLEGNADGDGKFGVYVAATESDPPETWPVYIIGNVISGMRHGTGTYSNDGGNGPGAITLRGSLERYVFNNTIYDCCSGIMTDGNIEDSITVFRNNIVAEITEAGSGATAGKHICFGDGASALNFESDFNLCYNSVGTSQYRYNSGNYDLAGFQANTPDGDNDLDSSPLFQSPPSDLQLQSLSPAVGAADVSPLADLNALYFSIFGVSIEFDFNRNPRPVSGAASMGAYEYVGPAVATLNATTFRWNTLLVG